MRFALAKRLPASSPVRYSVEAKKENRTSPVLFFGDPYGYLRYSASGDLSESVVENKVFSSREPVGFIALPVWAPKSKNPKANCVRFRILL